MLGLDRRKAPLLVTGPSEVASERTIGLLPLSQLGAIWDSEDPALRSRHSGPVVVTDEVLAQPEIVHQLASLSVAGVRVMRARDYYERVQRRVALDQIDESWFLFDKPLAASRRHALFQRSLDVVAGVVGSLLVLLVLVPLLSVFVWLDDRGPLFFRQERVGRRGKLFRIWKFRTMRVDAEADGPVWAARNDARVTRIGRLLRRTRIDELPQFFNVLMGQMSLIGPRPERPVFVARLSKAIPFYDRRHLMTPGITGWATVRFGYGDSVTDKWRAHEFDLYYLKFRSPRLDLEILLRTMIVMTLRKGQ